MSAPKITTTVPVTGDSIEDVLRDARQYYAYAQSAWIRYRDGEAKEYALKSVARYAELDVRITGGEELPADWKGTGGQEPCVTCAGMGCAECGPEGS